MASDPIDNHSSTRGVRLARRVLRRMARFQGLRLAGRAWEPRLMRFAQPLSRHYDMFGRADLSLRRDALAYSPLALPPLMSQPAMGQPWLLAVASTASPGSLQSALSGKPGRLEQARGRQTSGSARADAAEVPAGSQCLPMRRIFDGKPENSALAKIPEVQQRKREATRTGADAERQVGAENQAGTEPLRRVLARLELSSPLDIERQAVELPSRLRQPRVRDVRGTGEAASARTDSAKQAGAEPLRRAVARLEHSSPLVVERQVVELLSRVLHLQVSDVKLYASQPADELARAAGADALAYGDRIVFRNGAYDPASPAGLALLGHELTHVARMQAQPADVRPPSLAERSAEENLAQHNERELLRLFSFVHTPLAGRQSSQPAPGSASYKAPPEALPWEPALSSGPSIRTTSAAPTMPASPMPTWRGATPRPAPSTRDVGVAEAPQQPQLSAAQVQQLKEQIYHDLIDRLRTEFERGA